MQALAVGVLLGWGAAIPLGPVNLEIVRRNLNVATLNGLVFGLGACTADLIYLWALCAGALYFLQTETLLNWIGFFGSCLLLWFAYQAFNMPAAGDKRGVKKAHHLAYFDGLMMTLINPYTILFWASISAQVALFTGEKNVSTVMAGVGLLVGTVSWVVVLNLITHHSKKRLSDKIGHRLNQFGGFILLGFAVLGLIKSITALTQ